MPTVQLKYSNFDHKASWKTVELSSLGDILHDVLEPGKFQDGFQAVYIHSRIYISDKKFLHWLCLDVESKDNHGSITANISAAQDLLMILEEAGLTKELVILLSGHGFRFVWPWIVPLEWKSAFSGWIQNNTCIDWGVNLGNKFFRMAGYRGNPNQGRNPQDIHIEALNNIQDLWVLTKEDYLFMVKGKPSLAMTWLSSVIPGPISLPVNWQTFLQEYRTRAEFNASLWAPEYLPEVSSIDIVAMWQQIHAYLDDSGIIYHERKIDNYTITKLNTCPLCGKKTGGPYITQNGILKCHRVTCDAGQRNGDRIKGLMPQEWVPGYTAIHAKVEYQDEGFNTVDEIRARFAIEAKKINEDLLFIGSPGTGKSYAVISAHVKRCLKSKIIYAVPTHKLADEIMEKAKSFIGDSINITHIKGRGEDNCHQWEKVCRIQGKGYKPGVMLCHSCKKKPCEYEEQFKALEKPGFVVTAHAQLCNINLDKLKVDTLIIDEDALPSFFQTETVELQDIMAFSGGYLGNGFEKISKCIHRIYQAATERTDGTHLRRYTGTSPKGSKWENTPTLWDDAEINDVEKKRMARHLAGFNQFDSESRTAWMWRLFKDDVNLIALNWLWTSLEKNHGFTYAKINMRQKPTKNRPMFQFVRAFKDLPQFQGQIIVLDGTGSKTEVDSLFNRDFVEVPGRLKINCEKTLIQIGMGKVKADKILNEKPILLKNIAKSAIEHLRPKDQKILIATHKIIEDHLFKVFQDLLPGRTVESIHFYGNRGINNFENFDSIICFGGPGTNQAARLDEAMLLFSDHKDRLKWFDQKATAELIQTVQRVRLSFGDKNLILIHRKWVPELGRLNGLIDGRKGSDKIVHSMEKAYQRARRFYKVYGFCTVEALMALGIGNVSQKRFISMATVLSYRHLYKYILIGDVTVKTRPFKPDILLFQRKNSVSDLIARLEVDFVGQRYEKKVHSSMRSVWTKAYGRIDAAQEFYRVFGKPFNPEDWRKK